MSILGRSFSRMNVDDLGVEISIYKNQTEDHVALIDNICVGGICISSESYFQSGSKILISLNKAKRQYVHGFVKWVVQNPDSKRYRYGIQFESTTGEENRIVADFMATLLGLLTKEKIIAKTIDLFCSGLLKDAPEKPLSFKDKIRRFLKVG